MGPDPTLTSTEGLAGNHGLVCLEGTLKDHLGPKPRTRENGHKPSHRRLRLTTGEHKPSLSCLWLITGENFLAVRVTECWQSSPKEEEDLGIFKSHRDVAPGSSSRWLHGGQTTRTEGSLPTSTHLRLLLRRDLGLGAEPRPWAEPRSPAGPSLGTNSRRGAVPTSSALTISYSPAS